MEFKPIVTPDLYMSVSMLFVAILCFRMALHSLIRARRARVTLRRVTNGKPTPGPLASDGTVSEHRTARYQVPPSMMAPLIDGTFPLGLQLARYCDGESPGLLSVCHQTHHQS